METPQTGQCFSFVLSFSVGEPVWTDALLHSLVVMSAYLLWPLASAKHFHYRNVPHWIFSLDGAGCVDQMFLKYSDQPICHQKLGHVQSHLNHFLFSFWCSAGRSSCSGVTKNWPVSGFSAFGIYVYCSSKIKFEYLIPSFELFEFTTADIRCHFK